MARERARVHLRDGNVGIVLAVTPTGLLTARSPDATFAPEGTSVADATGRLRGRVVRVFGPVARPYLSVRLRRLPRPTEATALVGSMLVREGGRNTDAAG